MKKLLLGLTLLSGSAFGQDYYVPVPKELEHLARLPIKDFKLDDESASYQLPKEITGRLNKITLKRDLVLGSESLRIYRGDKAELSCMGTNDLPACVVTHRNLDLNESEVNTFLREKYKDPDVFAKAAKVSIKFASEAQPLGVISKRSPDAPPPMPKSWQLNILKTDSATGLVTEDWSTHLLDLSNSTFGDGWKLSKISVEGNHVSAYYQRPGQMHWLDLFVSTDGKEVQGTWGFVDGNGVRSKAEGVLKTVNEIGK